MPDSCIPDLPSAPGCGSLARPPRPCRPGLATTRFRLQTLSASTSLPRSRFSLLARRSRAMVSSWESPFPIGCPQERMSPSMGMKGAGSPLPASSEPWGRGVAETRGHRKEPNPNRLPELAYCSQTKGREPRWEPRGRTGVDEPGSLATSTSWRNEVIRAPGLAGGQEVGSSNLPSPTKFPQVRSGTI
jgi:hypothetical protein